MSTPEIAIVAATEFDLMVMRDAAKALDRFGVPYNFKLLEVHRNPDSIKAFAENAHKEGLCAIIAGASGAAHLPGMVAAYSPLPVIGVPIKAVHSIDGLDAIYSILQMPVGVPVATMALNGARNAAFYALQILACKHPSYMQLVSAAKNKERDEAQAQADKLADLGAEEYIANLK